MLLEKQLAETALSPGIGTEPSIPSHLTQSSTAEEEERGSETENNES